MPEPQVSVVVPTFRRPHRLARLLASLAEQDLEPAHFEVIIVDNGGDGATRELLAGWAARVQSNLRWLAAPPPGGPAAARNAGWRAAQAPLVAFTDDDCLAAPGWLRAGVRAAQAHPKTFVQGRTVPERGGTRGGVLSRTVAVEELGPQYETCNIFYPRATLEVLGGFDENFGPRPSAEDTDLAWRALEAGYEARFATEALVRHAVAQHGVLGTLRIATRWSDAMRLFARHPGARVMLHHRIFWNVWHYLWWRSLLALVLPRPVRRMLIARHLRLLRRRAVRAGAGGAALIWAVPFLVLHDGVECLAIARGAMRHRVLVL